MMTTSPPFNSSFAVHRWHLLVVVFLLATCGPSASAQDDKGCEGVKFAKHPRSEYSLANLKGRLEKDPKDVDALVHLGLHLEEQDQFNGADYLYKGAIQARPGCYLGYYFAGLLEDRISRKAASDAEANVNKALGLKPSLRDNGNVQGFMKRRAREMNSAPPEAQEQPSAPAHLRPAVNRFAIGLGVGLLLAALVFYLAGPARTAQRGA